MCNGAVYLVAEQKPENSTMHRNSLDTSSNSYLPDSNDCTGPKTVPDIAFPIDSVQQALHTMTTFGTCRMHPTAAAHSTMNHEIAPIQAIDITNDRI